MLLGNRFKTEDKYRLWTGRGYCQLCGSNQNCSAHHTTGCKADNSDSILNSVMVCFECHSKLDGQNVDNIKLQNELINKTLKIAREEDYYFVQRDYLFLKDCENRGMVLLL